MPRVLVILPSSSYRTGDFVRAAERMGVELAVASEETPPIDMGERFVRVDCSNPQASAAAIVALADRSPIDARRQRPVPDRTQIAGVTAEREGAGE